MDDLNKQKHVESTSFFASRRKVGSRKSSKPRPVANIAYIRQQINQVPPKLSPMSMRA